MPNGRVATKTASKTIYNDIKLSQEMSHKEHRPPPPSEPPPLEANRAAICYYPIDEGRVLHLTILYKYYTLIYKIRLHLLQLRLDYDHRVCPSFLRRSGPKKSIDVIYFYTIHLRLLCIRKIYRIRLL